MRSSMHVIVWCLPLQWVACDRCRKDGPNLCISGTTFFPAQMGWLWHILFSGPAGWLVLNDLSWPCFLPLLFDWVHAQSLGAAATGNRIFSRSWAAWAVALSSSGVEAIGIGLSSCEVFICVCTFGLPFFAFALDLVLAGTGMGNIIAAIVWVSRPALNPLRHKSTPAARQTESDPAPTTLFPFF